MATKKAEELEYKQYFELEGNLYQVFVKGSPVKAQLICRHTETAKEILILKGDEQVNIVGENDVARHYVDGSEEKFQANQSKQV